MFQWGAFDPVLDGQVLTFELHGVYQGTFTIVDDQVGSIWSQLTGEALVGPMAGRYLEPIALQIMPLGAWLERYPNSSTMKPGEVPFRPTRPGHGRLDEGWFRTISHRDRRLPPRTPVLGVRLGEARGAYVLDSQAQGPRLFEDELAGVPIVLVGVDGGAPLAYDRRVESGTIEVRLENGTLLDTSGSVWNHEGLAIDGALAGTQLKFVPSKVSEWYAWVAYHPDTDVVRFPASALLRGEIRLVDLDPARPSEAGKRRPAVLVSNGGANTTAAQLGRGVITVVPLSASVDRVYPFQVLLTAAETGLDRDSKAQAEQVRSISVERVSHKVGTVLPRLMLEIDDSLRLHLAL